VRLRDGLFLAFCFFLLAEILSWETASWPGPCLVQEEHNQQAPNNNNHKDCPTFLSGLVVVGQIGADFIKHNDNDKVIIGAFTIVLAVSTIGLWLATVSLQRTTNSLWEAGERQLRHSEGTAERQLRAYLSIMTGGGSDRAV
jgi:hypothetical protein